jgi:CesT_Tir_1
VYLVLKATCICAQNRGARPNNRRRLRIARGTHLCGAEEKPMPYFDTVKQYLLDLQLSIVREDPANGLVVVEDEDRGLKNLVVDCEEPLLVFEQIIMPVPSNPGEMFRRLLQMNRCLVQGAFALDEEGKWVLYRNTLQLANLDPNEVEGTIEALSLALAEFATELMVFNKQ